MRLTREQVEEMVSAVSSTATSAPFLHMLQKINVQDSPTTPATVYEAIAELQRAVSPPEGFRITTRAFEPPRKPVAYFDEKWGVGCLMFEGSVITVEDRDSIPTGRGTPDHIRLVIREGLAEIARFVATPSFQALLDEMYALPKNERPTFVSDVVIDPQQRARRGITVPDDMVIQRSKFADGRPTLFCVTKVLPLAYPWHKVTMTFDSEQ
jgi:hypothetical protein